MTIVFCKNRVGENLTQLIIWNMNISVMQRQDRVSHSDLIIGTDHNAIFTIIPNTDIPNPPLYRTQRYFSIKKCH